MQAHTSDQPQQRGSNSTQVHQNCSTENLLALLAQRTMCATVFIYKEDMDWRKMQLNPIEHALEDYFILHKLVIKVKFCSKKRRRHKLYKNHGPSWALLGGLGVNGLKYIDH